MINNTKVSAIMTTDLVTINSQDLFTKVDAIFKENNFHHIPVVDNGQLVGIISKSDYLMLSDPLSFFRKKLEQEKNKRFFETLLAEEVMTQCVRSLRPDDTVSVAVNLFKENLFHSIPIVDHHNQLLGILTPIDLIKHAYQAKPVTY